MCILRNKNCLTVQMAGNAYMAQGHCFALYWQIQSMQSMICAVESQPALGTQQHQAVHITCVNFAENTLDVKGECRDQCLICETNVIAAQISQQTLMRGSFKSNKCHTRETQLSA